MRGSQKNVPLGFALGFLGIVIFGATLPATVLALEAFDPLFLTFGRALTASVAAAICLVVMRRKFPRTETGRLLGAGAMLVYGFPGFSALAMQTVSANHGGVVLGILPLATAVFATMIAGERPSALFWVFAIFGCVLVIWFVTGGSELQLSAGIGWLLLAGLVASIGYVFSAQAATRVPGWEVISWALILTTPVSLAGAILTWQDAYASAPLVPALAFAYTGLFSMFLGFFAWNSGLAIGGIAKVGQIQLLQIFVTVALSALLLGETITLRTILFALAVATTVWLGRKARVS